MKRILTLLYKCLPIYWRIRRPVTLGSRALVVQDEKVLLVRLTYQKGWHLPGGGVNKGESFEQSAFRELREECGIDAPNMKLFGLYLNKKQGKIDHVAVFVSQGFEGTLGRPDQIEIEEIRFFPRDHLPSDVAPGHRRRIEEYFGLRSLESSW